MNVSRLRYAATAASVGLLAPVLTSIPPAQATGITYISFEDVTAHCGFAAVNPLRNRYAAAKFSGPSSTEGGAVLDQCGGFGVTARTGSRFLAFNGGVSMANGGVARGPEKITLPVRQKSVSIWVSQSGATVGNATFRIAARRNGTTVTTASATTATSEWVELKVSSAKGIDNVTLSTPVEPDGIWVADDLTMHN
jgi:hypothetical protein